MKLTIIIPVYNEVNWVTRLLENVRNAPLNESPGLDEVELILVDDGSTDGTTEKLQAIASAPFKLEKGPPAQLRFISLTPNRGKANAVREAVKASTGDFIILQDADLEYSPEDYPALLEPILNGRADVVFGSRYIGNPRRVLFFWHSLGNQFFTWVCNLVHNMCFTDVAAGYKVIPGDLFRALRLTSDRFGLEIELASRLTRTGVRIFEVPIRYEGRSYLEGKKINARDAVLAFAQVFWFGFFDRAPFQDGAQLARWVIAPHKRYIYGGLINRAFEFLGNSSHRRRILEIGAGHGTVTALLLKRGDVVATDNRSDSVRVLQSWLSKRSGCDARLWDPVHPPWENAGTFDVVVATNVLGRVENEVEALRTWSALLSPGGALILTVPQYQFLFSSLDREVAHLRRYDREGLEVLLAESGLEIVYSRNGNPLAVLGWLVYGKIFRVKNIGKSSFVLYRMLATLLYPLDKLMAPFIGLERMVVCRKKVHQRPQEVFSRVA